MATTESLLKVALTDTGCIIRMEGQGTMVHSPAARDIALRTLEGDPAATVVFDLSACEYLDSTFLGCLMEVYRQTARSNPPRYCITAPPELLKKLLGPTHIDRLIPALPAPPAARGQWFTILAQDIDKKTMMRHVMQCHRALAEVEGPMRGAFAKIADQMELELSKS
jgi:anti-anti-sigma factor